MNPKSIECDADALTTTPPRRYTVYVILMHVSVIKDTSVSEGVKKMSVVVVLNLFRSLFGISNAETHR